MSGKNTKLKTTWSKYWENYRGVTKIGAWAQRKALEKTFLIIKEEEITSSTKVVDIGCGEGRTLRAFRDKGFSKSIGVEYTEEGLQKCHKNGFTLKKDVFFGDAVVLKFKDRDFGLVFSEGLLEHYRDPGKIIKEMARISKDYVLLIQPNHYSLAGIMIAVLGHILRNNVKEYSFNVSYFVKEFSKAGFDLRSKKYTQDREYFVLLFKRSEK